MPPDLNDWLTLLLRWFHFGVGVSWIGTSFYFNWLNNTVRPAASDAPGDGDPDVRGELWAVHGGGFYRVMKYAARPGRVPSTLHWFKWEAYLTWLSGFSLLGLVYYHNPAVYLLKPGSPLSAWGAAGIGVGSLVAGWLLYDRLCRSPLVVWPSMFTVVGLILTMLFSWMLTLVFDGRGAYMHTGAMLGTLMAWNVFFVIIPGQKRMVADLTEGREPDPQPGIDGARRSLHNNYLTLPVLFVMISSHYPFTYGHRWNWAILFSLMLLSAAVRHWFNLRGQGHRNVWILPAATVGLLGLAFVASPRSVGTAATLPTPGLTEADAPEFSRVWTVVSQRCAVCHSASPSDPVFRTAPNGIVFDTAEQIRDAAALIHDRAVVTHQMPLGNRTGITEEERRLLADWFATGARVE
jgi:uncharacterized membrane protein